MYTPMCTQIHAHPGCPAKGGVRASRGESAGRSHGCVYMMHADDINRCMCTYIIVLSVDVRQRAVCRLDCQSDMDELLFGMQMLGKKRCKRRKSSSATRRRKRSSVFVCVFVFLALFVLAISSRLSDWHHCVCVYVLSSFIQRE